ncbi:MAG: hypothetical protein JWM36_1005 [Hyphomicrobiales bacterium]|nr:hypothetical protein [Hyphomicrobiales bacterium]
MKGESARTRANLQNAARSTGPKSPAGKARISKNALRHGLSLPVLTDGALGPRIAPLAQAIAGPGADLPLMAAAAAIAEAELDLQRVQQERHRLILQPLLPRLTRGHRDGPWSQEGALNALARLPQRRIEQIAEPTERAEPWDAICYFARAFSRLDRYERRALSRRRKAIRVFDALAAEDARVGAVAAGGPGRRDVIVNSQER